MPHRILRPLLGLMVVAAVAAAPQLASGDPTGAAAGNPGCNDNYPPYSNWGHGWYGYGDGHRYWNGWGDGNGYFDGHAYDHGCNYGGNAAQKPHVVRVMVAAKRLRGDGICQHLRKSGRLSRPKTCAGTHWMKADGTSKWRFDIAKALPTGRYRLHRRAIDSSGNVEKAALLHLRIR